VWVTLGVWAGVELDGRVELDHVLIIPQPIRTAIANYLIQNLRDTSYPRS
jgi:hypothetical protein